MTKQLLSGNDAIARGAYEAGATVGVGYPGTPSTEILQALSTCEGVYTEWSVNEKVALEVGLGAALAGARALVTMKHVGVNVAADPLFTAAYTGVKGGLVLVSADDPGMHSSQNEQDNRNYAYAAKVPMLDPSDSQEAKDFTVLAFALSEAYDTPVMLRTTTRISHSLGVVATGEKTDARPSLSFEKNSRKYVMIPGNARVRRVEVEKRLQRIAADAESLPINRIEYGDTDTGFITSGICYAYVKEAFPAASVLKLGMVYPLPEQMIREFCSKVKRVIVVEELDPFIEMRIKAMGLNVEGKKFLPAIGELDQDIIRRGITGEPAPAAESLPVAVPPRPPSLCPGCPHRSVFSLLGKHGFIVSGDIGCYTLGVLPPFNAMDTCIDMGASITVAQGMEIALGSAHTQKVAAVIGDSTFAHSGITGLVNAAYNKRNSLIIVLDNSTTAMTGMQPNPLSGERITGEPAVQLDYRKIAEAVGISSENFVVVDAYHEKVIEEALLRCAESKKLSMIVVKSQCIVLKARKAKRKI